MRFKDSRTAKIREACKVGMIALNRSVYVQLPLAVHKVHGQLVLRLLHIFAPVCCFVGLCLTILSHAQYLHHVHCCHVILLVLF